MWGKEEESERGRNIKHSRKPSSFKVAGKEGGFWRVGVGPHTHRMQLSLCPRKLYAYLDTHVHSFPQFKQTHFPFFTPIGQNYPRI